MKVRDVIRQLNEDGWYQSQLVEVIDNSSIRQSPGVSLFQVNLVMILLRERSTVF